MHVRLARRAAFQRGVYLQRSHYAPAGAEQPSLALCVEVICVLLINIRDHQSLSRSILVDKDSIALWVISSSKESKSAFRGKSAESVL